MSHAGHGHDTLSSGELPHSDHHASDHGHDAAAGVNPDAPAPTWAVRGVANPDDPQDIWNMGGLRHRMPITFWTYLMGTLALTGIPIWSGFWSKDEILAHTYEANQIVVWIVLTSTAGLTAFYMARQVFLVFFGQPRTEMARVAKESPWTMTMPLAVLAFFATFVGLLGMPDSIGPLHVGNWFHHWAGLTPTTGLGEEALHAAEEPTHLNFLVAGLSVAIAVAGWALGYLVYGRRRFRADETDPLARLGLAWRALRNAYYVDRLYDATAIRASVAVSSLLALFDGRVVDGLVNLAGRVTVLFSRLNRWFDTYVVDGMVNGLAIVTEEYGRVARLIQTGYVQNYLLVVFISILILSGIFLAIR